MKMRQTAARALMAVVMAFGASCACLGAAAGNAETLWVQNVKFQQRYPWNGKVDISFDVKGQDLVKLGVTVLTNGVLMGEAKSIQGDMELSLGLDVVETNGVHLVWDAAKDLPAGFKNDNVKVKVAVEQIVSDYKVRYLEMGTDKELVTTKVVKDAHVGRTVTELAEGVEYYTLTSENSQNLEVGRNSAQNVITFYYQRTMTSYTVRYVDKNNPDKELATALTVKNVAAGITATCRAIEIEDFEVDGAMTQELLVNSDAAQNVVTFYYVPAQSNDTGYTVIYIDIFGAVELGRDVVTGCSVGTVVTPVPKEIEGFRAMEGITPITLGSDPSSNIFYIYYIPAK